MCMYVYMKNSLKFYDFRAGYYKALQYLTHTQTLLPGIKREGNFINLIYNVRIILT